MRVYGQSEPAAFRFEMKHAKRSFWSFLTKSRIHFDFVDPPSVFVDSLLDLAVRINAASPCTPITVVWNQDPHLDTTGVRRQDEDDRHHVAFSCVPFSFRAVHQEYGSLTAWRTVSRPWVGINDMTVLEVPGMIFFAMTGEYACKYSCQLPHGKWLIQVLPKLTSKVNL